MDPLVSVVMPCRNAGRMLEPSLWSVFAQSYPNVEFIFVDNNSTDGSAERARAFAADKPRPFHFLHCPEQGANHARNMGFALARGDYIQWLDADDALGIDKIALQVAALERDPDAAIAYCDWMSSRHLPDGRRLDRVQALGQVDDQITRALSGVWYPPHSYLIRRQAADMLQAESAWLPSTKVGTDVEYSAIAALLGMRFRHVPGAKIQYNTWSDEQTSGTATPYEVRVAEQSAIWRRLREFANRPDVAPRITAGHRMLLEQDWHVWSMPLGSVEIGTLASRSDGARHSLLHVASGRTIEVGPREAMIATFMIALGTSRAHLHHALMIAGATPMLRDDHTEIVTVLERFRREGFLEEIEPAAAMEDRTVTPAAPIAARHRADASPAVAVRAHLPASPATREAVAAAWTEALRGRGLSENERFDAAGGDSLALLNFALSCEARLGIPVSLDALSLRMRPSDFARVLDGLLREAMEGDETDIDDGPSVNQGPGDDPEGSLIAPELPVIYLIRVRHHLDPSEVILRRACAGLAQVVPIPLPPWPVLVRPDFDFPALLDHIAGQIEPRRGAEPVMLAGLCFGGMLAHAVATRLAAAGRRIGFLGILDGDAEWALNGAPSHIRAMGLAVRRGPGFSGLAPSAARWIIRRPRLLRWIGENRRMDRLPRKFAARLNWHLNTDIPGHFDRGGLARLLRLGGRLDAPVFLFRSLEQAPGAPADLHWRQWCSQVTVVPILGNHYSMFAPENLALVTHAVARVARMGLAASGLTPAVDPVHGVGEVSLAAAETVTSLHDTARTAAERHSDTSGASDASAIDDDRWAKAEFAATDPDA